MTNIQFVGGDEKDLVSALASHMSLHLQIPFLHSDHPHANFYVYLRRNNALIFEKTITGTRMMYPLGNLEWKLLKQAADDGVFYPNVTLVGFPEPRKSRQKIKGNYEEDLVTPIYEFLEAHFGTPVEAKVEGPHFDLTQNPTKFDAEFKGTHMRRLRNANARATKYNLTYEPLLPADKTEMMSVLENWLTYKRQNQSGLDLPTTQLYNAKVQTIFEKLPYHTDNTAKLILRAAWSDQGELLAMSGVYKYGPKAAHTFRIAKRGPAYTDYRAQEFLDIHTMNELKDLGVTCLHIGLESMNLQASPGLLAYKEQFCPVAKESFLNLRWQYDANHHRFQ